MWLPYPQRKIQAAQMYILPPRQVQLFNVDLGHLKHGLHHPLRFYRVGVI